MPQSTSQRAARALCICAALAVAAAWALAAPLPARRAGGGMRQESAGAAGRVAPADARSRESGVAGVCATDPYALADEIERHIERTLALPQPTAYSIDTAGIAVLEDDGAFFYSGPGQNQVLDKAAVAQAFYRTHGDDYDALAIYLASGQSDYLGSPTALAAAFVVKNDVTGLGLDLFDLSPGLGTPAGLHTLLSMNGLDRYRADPDSIIGGPGDTFTTLDVLAHEFAHRWLAYVYVDSAGTDVPALLGRSLQHWNFFADVDSSVMEGCDWVSPAPDSFVTDGVTNGYGRLDQYLMGLRARSEIDSFFVVNDPTNIDPPGIYVPWSIPEVGVSCDGRATWWRLDDIESAEGVRAPDAASSPHAFHVATVLVTPSHTPATAADLDKLGLIRAKFPAYFATATSGRASMDLTLHSHAGSVHIRHVPLTDTEATLTPRTIGARVTIDQAGIRLAIDPASVFAFVRTNGAGSWNPMPLSLVAPDSFAGTLPGAPSGTHIEYYLSAASDSAGISATAPVAGAGAAYTFNVGPDTTPPVVTRARVVNFGTDRMPVTLLARIHDNAALDSAWIETAVNGGAPVASAFTSVSADSFSVRVGSGLQPGDVLHYRFVARDRAAAANVTLAPAAFDSVLVTQNWLEDFENGTPPDWEHTILRRRDPWALSTQRSSPPGGTSWKAGACDSTPYPPYLDGALITPRMYNLVAGTSFQFEHWFDLEEADASEAYDGAILEAQVGYDGPWFEVTTSGGYTHLALDRALGVGAPCWSGTSGGWRSESVDLTPYAPGPVRFRFHMSADDFVGREGWYVDHVRVVYPGSGPLAVPAGTPSLSIGAPSPNPARSRIEQALALPRAADIEWSLFDIAGRRLATLTHSRFGAGNAELAAPLPASLRSGLYFTRVAVDGRVRRVARLAIVR
jgi:hypothetical protein